MWATFGDKFSTMESHVFSLKLLGLPPLLTYKNLKKRFNTGFTKEFHQEHARTQDLCKINTKSMIRALTHLFGSSELNIIFNLTILNC